MKKKLVLILIVSGMFALLLTSCAKSSEAPNTTAGQASSEEKKSDEVQANDDTKESAKEDAVTNHMKITFDEGKVVDTFSHEYTVNYSDSQSGKICVINFSDNGHSYEMCVSSLAEEFTDDQINTMISAFLSETPAVLESDDLIDAEKFSNKIYGELGEWVFTDDDFRQVDVDYWGDSSMCWAASASDMLWNAGWASLAMWKNPDLSLNNVDDLFDYFCSNFTNGTFADAYDGIDWFMNGGYADHFPDMDPGNLPEYVASDYTKEVSFSDSNNIETGIELIKAIKDGGAVGLAVDFCQNEYPLKEDSDISVYYDPNYNGYVEGRYEPIDDPDKIIKSAFYVYDDKGLITIVDKKDEDTYTSSDGKEYDVFNVLKGDIYPLDDGSYSLIEDDGYISYSLLREPEDIDFDNVRSLIMIGNGAHAITVSGYVIDTGEDQAIDSVKALFIADSDNDAHYYNMPKEVRGNEISSRALRPNTMQLFRTSPVVVDKGYDDGNIDYTLNIEGYMKETYTAIAVLTGLKPAPRIR